VQWVRPNILFEVTWAAMILLFALQYLFVLGWAFYYYRIMRGRNAKLSLRFWAITVIPPVETHLSHIYRKTHTQNRLALFTMIKG
jgi:hypothetical protein